MVKLSCATAGKEISMTTKMKEYIKLTTTLLVAANMVLVHGLKGYARLALEEAIEAFNQWEERELS